VAEIGPNVHEIPRSHKEPATTVLSAINYDNEYIIQLLLEKRTSPNVRYLWERIVFLGNSRPDRQKSLLDYSVSGVQFQQLDSLPLSPHRSAIPLKDYKSTTRKDWSLPQSLSLSTKPTQLHKHTHVKIHTHLCTKSLILRCDS
jgi:hypothetical protein